MQGGRALRRRAGHGDGAQVLRQRLGAQHCALDDGQTRQAHARVLPPPLPRRRRPRIRRLLRPGYRPRPRPRPRRCGQLRVLPAPAPAPGQRRVRAQRGQL